MIHYNSLKVNNSEDLHIDQFVELIYESFDLEVTGLKSNMNQNNLEKLLPYSIPIVELSINSNLHFWDYGSAQLHKKLVA